MGTILVPGYVQDNWLAKCVFLTSFWMLVLLFLTFLTDMAGSGTAAEGGMIDGNREDWLLNKAWSQGYL